MTDQEALALLRGGPEGIRKWNSWREKSERLPYLRDARLVETQLGGANLSTTNLQGAQLTGADLKGTNLSNAILVSASLVEANMMNADLSGADVTGAELMNTKLNGSNLSRARMFMAHFRSCVLDCADFKEARCAGTEFCDVDLSAVRGLEFVEHFAASTVGIDTIVRSRGKIPKRFLRGCGVPEVFIDYIPDLVASISPLQFHSCFISYSHNDEEFCKKLHSRLQKEKLRVWFAPEKMKGGDYLLDQIESAIRVHDRLLLVLSEESMKSEWVAREIYGARQRERKEKRKVLFPIGLCSYDKIEAWRCFEPGSDRDMTVAVREYFIPDFSNWKNDDNFEREFGRLLEALRATETAKSQ